MNSETDEAQRAEPISIHFTYTIADQLYARRVRDNNVLLKGFFGKADKVMALLLIVASVFLTLFGGFRWWTWVFALAAIDLWFDVISLGRLQTYIFCKLNPTLLGPYSYAFDDAGLRITSATIESQVAWNHFSRLVESPRVFLLLYSNGPYTAVPKSAFASDDELSRFRRLAESKLKHDDSLSLLGSP